MAEMNCPDIQNIKMNQPARTFSLIGIVVFLLLAMHLLPTLSVDDIELRHVNILSSLLPEPEAKETEVVAVSKPRKSATVAVTVQGKHVQFTEKWGKGIAPIIDYSNGKTGGMEHFYAALDSIKLLRRPVRIAYYGDSYIEGDIFTADIREMFQAKFGGSGVGWVDCGTGLANLRRSVVQKHSGIKEYSVVKKPFNYDRQSLAERYYIPSEGARVTAKGSRFYEHAKYWSSAKLFFRTASSISVKVETPDGSSVSHFFDGSPDVRMLETSGNMQSITYRFSDVGEGTTLFGMALESGKGVILDNFSMRGSSGTTLAKIPMNTLYDFNNMRPYDLIILHFGLNVAVKGNPVSVLRAYTNKMKKAVQHFRAAFPTASILVISVPDRDQRSADGIKTMREVKNLVTLQDRLAADMQVGFFNFFEAMGGEESVKQLVDRNMANKDYTHLSFGGGRAVAKKVFPSFVAGLDNYKRRKKIEQE